jgi:hypothetical protein
MCVSHHGYRLNSTAAVRRWEFLSNSRDRRNARAQGRALSGLIGPLSYSAKIYLVFANAISNI